MGDIALAPSELQEGVELTGADLSGQDLSHHQLSESTFTECLFAGTNLRASNLTGATFVRCQFNSEDSEAPADLSQAQLRESRQ